MKFDKLFLGKFLFHINRARNYLGFWSSLAMLLLVVDRYHLSLIWGMVAVVVYLVIVGYLDHKHFLPGESARSLETNPEWTKIKVQLDRIEKAINEKNNSPKT